MDTDCLDLRAMGVLAQAHTCRRRMDLQCPIWAMITTMLRSVYLEFVALWDVDNKARRVLGGRSD